MWLTVEVDSMRYLKSSDEYDIKLSDASIISLDILKKQIRCKMKASRVKQIQEELDDDDLSSMLDDIDYDIDSKSQVSTATATATHKCIQQEWLHIAPKKKEKVRDKAYGSCSIGDCHSIERIVFMLKHYAAYMKYKSVAMHMLHDDNNNNHNNNNSNMYASMTRFISRLKGYNRVRLLNDFYHVKKYHVANESEKELIDYMKAKVPVCEDTEMCACCSRNEGDRQIYRALSNKGRRELYWIHDDVKDGSEEEMNEIVLIEYLDIIHTFFVHFGLISDGSKFITQIVADRGSQHNGASFAASSSMMSNLVGSPLPPISYGGNNNGHSACSRRACSPSLSEQERENKESDDSKEAEECVEDGEIEGRICNEESSETSNSDSSSDTSTVAEYDSKEAFTRKSIPMLNSSFGESLDYWKSSHPYFVRAVHKDLRSELLNNTICAMSGDDYELLEMKAKDYMKSDIGKHLECKREFRWMKKSSMKSGDKMSVEHMMCVLIATNYCEMMNTFRNIGCRKLDNVKESVHDIKKRQQQIAQFLRYLKEAIWYFGEVLSEKQRLYHGIDCKLAFSKCSISFDIPSSFSSKYVMAQRMMEAQNNGVVFKLGKVLNNEHNMVYLDVTNLSVYPADKERLIFGGNLGFVDILYDAASHSDDVMSLTLYQQILAGKWFASNSDNKKVMYFKKKYQRKVMKLIHNMIHYEHSHAVHNKYMQQLFEAITLSMKPHSNGNQNDNQNANPFAVDNQTNNKTNKNKTAWINQKECEKLLPELYTLLFDKFISYLLQHRVSVKYAFCMEMNLSVPHIHDSSFKKSLYSKKYKFSVCSNKSAEHDEKCSLHFRCYKKYDAQKQEDMFRGFIATQHKLPKSVSKIELKYGLHFEQLHFDKWDSCTLTNSQLYKGSSLFKMQQLHNLDTLNVKIAFQVRAVYDANGKLVQL